MKEKEYIGKKKKLLTKANTSFAQRLAIYITHFPAFMKLGYGIRDKVLILYLLFRYFSILLYSDLRRILTSPKCLHVKVGSMRVPLFLPEDFTSISLIYEIFVAEEYKIQTRKEPRIIIDVGANYGWATVYFSCHYPRAKVFAVEPSLRAIPFLHRNTEMFKGVKIIEKALSGHEGKVKLYFDDFVGEAFSSIKQTSFGKFETVECTTLDRIAAENDIGFIDIMKIDVEGAEYEILRDCKMLKRTGFISGEIHHEHVDDEVFFDLLRQCFSLKILHSDQVYTSFQASKKEVTC